MMDLAICVDIGGTKMAAGVVDRHGCVYDERSVRTPTGSDRLVIGEAIALARDLLSRLERKASIAGAGVGVPGTVDFDSGVLVFAPNLPLRNVPVKEIFETELGLTTRVDNDANLAALGEKVFGAGRNVRNLVMLTLGTGIGGGVIIDRRIYRGGYGGAGELGHMFIGKDDSGKSLDLEATASGTALVEKVKTRLAALGPSTPSGFADVETMTGESIAEAARKGDDLALSAFHDFASSLGVGLANIVNIFNPEVVVIGGGMADASDLFLEEARRVMEDLAIAPNGEQAKLVLAELGNRAGMMGAAALVFGAIVEHDGAPPFP